MGVVHFCTVSCFGDIPTEFKEVIKKAPNMTLNWQWAAFSKQVKKLQPVWYLFFRFKKKIMIEDKMFKEGIFYNRFFIRLELVYFRVSVELWRWHRFYDFFRDHDKCVGWRFYNAKIIQPALLYHPTQGCEYSLG